MFRLYSCKSLLLLQVLLTIYGTLSNLTKLQYQKVEFHTIGASSSSWKYFKINLQPLNTDSNILVTITHRSTKNEEISLELYAKIGEQLNEKSFDHKSTCSGNNVSTSVNFVRPIHSDVAYLGVYSPHATSLKSVSFEILFDIIEPTKDIAYESNSNLMIIIVAVVVGCVGVAFFFGSKKSPSKKVSHTEVQSNSIAQKTASTFKSVTQTPATVISPGLSSLTTKIDTTNDQNILNKRTEESTAPLSKEPYTKVRSNSLQQKIAAYQSQTNLKEQTPRQEIKPTTIPNNATKKNEEIEKARLDSEQNTQDEFKKQEEERKKRQIEEAMLKKKKQEEEEKKKLQVLKEQKLKEQPEVITKPSENIEQIQPDTSAAEFLRNKKKLTESQSTPTISTQNQQPLSEAISNFQTQSKTLPKFGKIEKCDVCGETVYLMEKMAIEGKIYHKKCFQCEVCKKPLSAGKFAALSGKNYCKPHFKQLFTLKGNYSEAFGEEKPQAQWAASHGLSATGDTDSIVEK